MSNVKNRYPLPFLTTLLVLLFFYLPIIVLIVNSFNAAKYGGSWQGFSLKWYKALWEHEAVRRALANTFTVGLASTALSTLIGTLGAMALHRYGNSKLQKLHTAMVWCPLMIPEILMGVSLLMFFGSFLKLNLGRATMIAAHTTFCISYVIMVVQARLQDFDDTILDAALDLGASWLQTTWKVFIPALIPGIAAGALLSFTLSIDDFVISFFVQGRGMTTLPIQVNGMLKRSPMGIINALSTLMVACTFILLTISQFLSGNLMTNKKGKSTK